MLALMVEVTEVGDFKTARLLAMMVETATVMAM
jgi:hypothetical protein